MSSNTCLSPAENFMGLCEEYSRPDAAQVIILPVPFECTSTFGRGSEHGPAAILAASHELETFDAVLGTEPFLDAGGIATLRPLLAEGLDGAALAAQLKALAESWLAQGKFLVTLGGEHTSVVGAIAAHCAAFKDLTILQLDAHSDLRAEYQDNAWNHACAMARVLEFHDDVVAVGIRSQTQQERQLTRDRGMAVFYAHEIAARDRRQADWIEQIIAATRGNVYITLDCDVMDPSLMPATGTPEPGGLSWRQLDVLLDRLCRARKVVGLDVSELAPIVELRHCEFTLAKAIYRLIGRRFGRWKEESI